MRFAIFVLTSLVLAISGPAQAGDPDVEYYPVSEDMQLPFSDAVRVGNMLYLSGKIGNIPGTRDLAEGGIAGETRQALENIKASLEKHGSSMDEVVKCTVFLADIAEWGAMNEVYLTYFPKHPPARSALGASGLALNSRVEIECFAALRD
jgi:2-iminobutanoate/2-iminopropanoate deaminase